jgi:hypothetical protein
MSDQDPDPKPQGSKLVKIINIGNFALAFSKTFFISVNEVTNPELGP